MAYIIGDHGRYTALDYPQLAKLYRDAVVRSIPEAQVEWERQPESEKRLGEAICKMYSGPAKKSKLSKAEKQAVKAQKPAVSPETDFLLKMAQSHDPLLREMAKKQLGK